MIEKIKNKVNDIFDSKPKIIIGSMAVGILLSFSLVKEKADIEDYREIKENEIRESFVKIFYGNRMKEGVKYKIGEAFYDITEKTYQVNGVEMVINETCNVIKDEEEIKKYGLVLFVNRKDLALHIKGNSKAKVRTSYACIMNNSQFQPLNIFMNIGQ